MDNNSLYNNKKNMETHLTIKHLAGYLPYGLKVLSRQTIFEMDIYSNMRGLGIEKRDIQSVISDNMKPILRPLSDLAKEIEVNAEKFVPIVEICKLSETVNEVLRINCKSNICGFDFKNGVYEILRFCYHFNTKHFQLTDEESDNQCFLNQLEMFEKLHEWHIDVYGLIDNNLAIDINEI